MGDSIWFHRATPQGEGGIALLEIYGEAVPLVLPKIFRPLGGLLPEPGSVRRGDVFDPQGSLIDDGLLALVPQEASWSRLTTWALSLHGGSWVQEKAIEALRELGGQELDLRGVLRLAVDAEKLDCVEAAAYELLVSARTEKAAAFFARQHAGQLSRLLRAGLELAEAGALAESSALARQLLRHASEAFRLGHPLQVLIAGRPNAGKSTLFNRLNEEERAAVSRLPGTTRDTLESEISIHDFPVRLADSAGIRPLADVGEVERKGIEQTLSRQDAAILYLLPLPWRLTDEDLVFLQGDRGSRALLCASFSDLGAGAEPPRGALQISPGTGEGIEVLRRRIVERWISAGAVLLEDIPPAPFTSRLWNLLRGLVEPPPGREVGLDGHRRAYLECLQHSWPQ